MVCDGGEVLSSRHNGNARLIKIVKETKLAKKLESLGVAMPTAFSKCLDIPKHASIVVRAVTCHRNKKQKKKALQTMGQLPPAD